MHYRIAGEMRKVGAIGRGDFTILHIEADSPREAIAKVYDTHQHLHGVTIQWDEREPESIFSPTFR